MKSAAREYIDSVYGKTATKLLEEVGSIKPSPGRSAGQDYLAARTASVLKMLENQSSSSSTKE